MEAIKDENSEFGRYLDLNRPEKQGFQDLVTFCQSKYDVFCSVEVEDQERKSSEIFYNFNHNPQRRGNHDYEDGQVQYPMLIPFPFLSMPNFFNQPNFSVQSRPDHNNNFKNKFNSKQQYNADKNNYNNSDFDRDNQNRGKERMATKVPKDHKVKYIEETDKRSKNL